MEFPQVQTSNYDSVKLNVTFVRSVLLRFLDLGNLKI